MAPHYTATRAQANGRPKDPGPGEKVLHGLRYTWVMDIEQMAAELFDVFDENRDGVISRREFVALVEALLHEKRVGLSSDIFKKFDSNHDNLISKEELIDMIVELAL